MADLRWHCVCFGGLGVTVGPAYDSWPSMAPCSSFHSRNFSTTLRSMVANTECAILSMPRCGKSLFLLLEESLFSPVRYFSNFPWGICVCVCVCIRDRSKYFIFYVHISSHYRLDRILKVCLRNTSLTRYNSHNKKMFHGQMKLSCWLLRDSQCSLAF